MIAPRYRIDVPNDPVVLATGPVTLTQERFSELQPDGSVTVSWLTPVGVVVTSPSQLFHIGPVEVVAQNGVSIDGEFCVMQMGSRGTKALALGDVLITRLRSEVPLIDHVDIHVLNLPHVPGEAVYEGNRSLFTRERWKFGHWDMIMDPIFFPVGAEHAAKAVRGNLLTHVIRACRTDTRPFDQEDLSQLLEGLYLALSFAFGDHIGCMLAAGRSKNGDVVVEFFRRCASAGWRQRWGPAPTYSGIGTMMNALGNIFASPDETIRETVLWHLEACFVSPELSIVVSQASLEKLAYLVLVKQRGLVKDSAFDKRAAHNIRLMMQTLDVPTSNGTTNNMDIPALITKARNNQVHARRKDPVEATDAHDVALQTLELSLLKLAGYEGRYHPRGSRHAAAEQTVPWV